ncbi:L-amino acid N-acyltransferase YncA [Cryobacterium sp. MP_M5]|nr:phosphinothricin acetyltransferase [Cryobacterium sp. MP_M3]MEC5176522.1 L-amino acid N-acyltransferase YncA [Cryobacterium sp. MP_M5]
MTIVRPMTAADWPAVRTIYAAGIATGHATFEANPPAGWAQFDCTRILEPRLVAVDDDRVLGWVAATPVSTRAVYRGVIEHSVYVASDARGAGVGSLLLKSFITAAEENGHWTIQSSVFPENTASLRLHEGAGFRVIGRRERIALMSYGPAAGTWRDTILIERRNSLNGTP